MSDQDTPSASNQEAVPKPKAPPIDLASIPRPTRSVEVNGMTYTDDQGTKHNIYLPKGTARVATKLLTENMYDELAKFPPYSACPATYHKRVETPPSSVIEYRSANSLLLAGQGYDNWDNDPETYADFIKGLEQFEYLFKKNGEDDLGLIDPAENLADQTGELGVGRD